MKYNYAILIISILLVSCQNTLPAKDSTYPTIQLALAGKTWQAYGGSHMFTHKFPNNLSAVQTFKNGDLFQTIPLIVSKVNCVKGENDYERIEFCTNGEIVTRSGTIKENGRNFYKVLNQVK
jgi:hypothetical protein